MKRTHASRAPSSKGPGRPPVAPGDASVLVGVTVGSKQFAGYCRRAHRADVSVPEIIRRDLQKKSKK